jgi:hypothetical protein
MGEQNFGVGGEDLSFVQSALLENFKSLISTFAETPRCKVSQILKESSLVGLTNAFQILVQYKTILLDFDTVDW